MRSSAARSGAKSASSRRGPIPGAARPLADHVCADLLEQRARLLAIARETEQLADRAVRVDIDRQRVAQERHRRVPVALAGVQRGLDDLVDRDIVGARARTREEAARLHELATLQVPVDEPVQGPGAPRLALEKVLEARPRR